MPEARSLKKKKSVIPEQIPFLPGLSAPSDSLPTTTVPPLSQCPTSLHIKKKKEEEEKKRWRIPSSLAFPTRAWKLEEIQIKLTAHQKINRQAIKGGAHPTKDLARSKI